jgi:hypothetical protein
MKTTKPKIVILSILLCTAIAVIAWASSTMILKKDNQGTASGSTSSSNYQLEMSVGECVVGTASNGTMTINSGYVNANIMPTATAIVYIPNKTTTKVFNSRINPMKNEKARIRLHINEETHVRMELYTMRGTRVSVLADEEYMPGEYFIEWGGTNSRQSIVASGIYILHVIYKDKREVRKIAVIK